MANVISKSQSIVSKAEILGFDGCGPVGVKLTS